MPHKNKLNDSWLSLACFEITICTVWPAKQSLSLSLFLSSSRFEARSAPVNEWAKQSPTALGSIGRPPGTQLRKKKQRKAHINTQMKTAILLYLPRPTVDGRDPANQLSLVVYPIMYKGLAPSQVVVGDSEPSTVPPSHSTTYQFSYVFMTTAAPSSHEARDFKSSMRARDIKAATWDVFNLSQKRRSKLRSSKSQKNMSYTCIFQRVPNGS